MKDIKEFKNKYGLSGLHSQPIGYMNFEDKTEEVFKDVELLIKETREKTIMEIEENLPLETFDNTYNYALKEVRDILNKLK